MRFICSVKVLILHQHFKTPQSGGAIRSYYLAKALVDHGHQAVVITAHNQKRIKVENYEGIEVHYLPIAYDNSYEFGKRGVAFLRFALRSVRHAKKVKDIDLCYAISVPLTVGVAAIWLKKRRHIPFIFEVGDLWPDAPIELGFITNYFFKRFLYSLERDIYQAARQVVALSPAIKTAIERKVPGVKVSVIPNMADTEFYQPEQKDPRLVEQFGVQGKWVVSYIGAMGMANGLDYVIECANATRKAEMSVHFLVAGEGALKKRLMENAKRLQLNNITFLDFQNREGVREIMNVSDAVFICYKRHRILETGSPNKFFDGLAAGKMIILNFGGWIRKEVEENQCGIFVDPNYPNDFVKKVSGFINDQKELALRQRNARDLAEKKYARKQLAADFLKTVSR